MKQNSHTIKLTAEQQEKLIVILQDSKYTPVEVPHTRIAVSAENCRINLYNSGKCLIQGKGAEDWITFTLEPEVTGEARLGYEAVHDPESVQPHMGIDESGKGDLFGPLVISAVYTDAKTVEILQEIGAKDSKRISSDRVALQLASAIRKQLDGKYTIVTLGPEAYNRMYASMKNVNRVLAWGHARAIENLLEKVPDCPRALSDKFGPTHRIETALMKNGKKIQMDQRTKAESDPAVAAASILARAAFLNALRGIEKTCGIETVPKGCSAKVKQIATELVAAQGPGILTKACKLHFKTTEEVLKANGYTRADLTV
ncbi:MAG: ribonuclease HIII [Kiritimatiellales bacterium]|nr:ribonuclease HIII [Kiritimatiellota bacterium]MBL7011856.1 ribonuclease HIII [Kiritimatiellales bacterium]